MYKEHTGRATDISCCFRTEGTIAVVNYVSSMHAYVAHAYLFACARIGTHCGCPFPRGLSPPVDAQAVNHAVLLHERHAAVATLEGAMPVCVQQCFFGLPELGVA